MLQFVRRGLLVAALVVAGLVAVEVAPASAAPADGTYITCTQDPETSPPTYIVVGGAPIWVRSWAAMGKWTTDNPHPTPTPTNCSALAAHPKNGTFIRGWKAGAATGSTYEIVGGAPVTVHAWKNLGRSTAPTVEKVDAVSIPAAGAAATTKDGTYALQGYLNAKPSANTAFRGYATKQYYKLDSALHVVPQTAAAPSGTIDVDQASINACERMNCNPNGQIVNSGATGYGVLHVDGWAMDYPSAASVSVQLTAGGSTFVVPANQQTNAVLPSIAGAHGFAADLSIAAGSYVLCGTVLGTTPGATTQDLGCSNVSVPGAKPGKVHRPKEKAQGRGKVRVRWKTPVQNGSPVNLYVVKVSVGAKHKKKQVAGSKHKVVLKHLPRGQQVRVKVKANNLYGFGRASKKSKPVRVR